METNSKLNKGEPMKNNLEINAAADGTWLTFNASTGKSATLRLESLVEHKAFGPITKQAILDWCNDRQATKEN